MVSSRRLALALSILGATAAAAACGEDLALSSPAGDAGTTDAGVEAGVALCVDGRPAFDYPPGPHELSILSIVPPGLSFDAESGPVKIESFFEPCAPKSRVLVIRTSATWCGPCQWQAAHTKRFLEDPRFAGRLLLLDLLVAGEDNVPATPAELPRWAAKIDATSQVAADPKYTFAPVLLSPSPLPAYVFVDTRTMKILSTLTDPDPVSLAHRIEQELAALDGAKPPDGVSPPLTDGRWTENEWDLIRGMRLGDLTPPADPTNAYGDLPAAALLGKKLFADTALSPSGNVSCAKCHDLGQNLTDGVPQSTGVAKVDRNAPGVALSAHARWQFWDGRADTLWMQALGPFEDAREIGSSRLFVAQQIAQRYASDYAAVFGAKYPLPDLSSLPAAGKPGETAYDTLSADDKDAVTRIFVNAAKAIAAYERAMRVKPNALDRYADGDVTALTDAQKDGLTVFLRSGCTQCHWGPRLSDDAFHVLRFPTGRQDGAADPGRSQGLVKLAAAEFAASSKWSDAPSAAKKFTVDVPSTLGAFKTPTLRGVSTSAPYGHGGTLATLDDVTKHYGNRGLPPDDPRAVGTTEPWVPRFDQRAAHDLPTFLDVLSGEAILP